MNLYRHKAQPIGTRTLAGATTPTYQNSEFMILSKADWFRHSNLGRAW